MASQDSMLFKFFEKWKQRRLNKLAKKTLKDNPGLEQALRDLDKEAQKVVDLLDKRK